MGKMISPPMISHKFNLKNFKIKNKKTSHRFERTNEKIITSMKLCLLHLSKTKIKGKPNASIVRNSKNNFFKIKTKLTIVIIPNNILIVLALIFTNLKFPINLKILLC